MKLVKFSLCSALLAFAYGTARCEEDGVLLFKDVPFPIEARIAPGGEPGSRLFETPLSEPLSADYDTVLIDGLMPDPDVQIQIRVKYGANFKVLTQSESKRFPNGRFWAKFQLGGPTREPLKIAVTSGGAASASTLTIYSAEVFIRTAEKEASGKPASADRKFTHFDPKPPSTELSFIQVDRSDWGARQPMGNFVAHSPDMITLHHTQGSFPSNYTNAVTEMQYMQSYHQAKGWTDIGYHYVISPQGDIFEGRPVGMMGAHVSGKNENNIGISIMGSYNDMDGPMPTNDAIYSLIALTKYLQAEYKIGANRFYAHRDLDNTDCPGKLLYSRMGILKSLLFNPSSGKTKAMAFKPLTGGVAGAAEQLSGASELYPALRDLLDSYEGR